jgi:hypothetical protein
MSGAGKSQAGPRRWRCDRCGFAMVERQCKVICPNCGARWDCSDLSIWLDSSDLMSPDLGQAGAEPRGGSKLTGGPPGGGD